MKTKILVKKMTRQQAVDYMSKSKYKLPTLEEVSLYGDNDILYWTDNDKEHYDTEFSMFVGQFAATTTGQVAVNKVSLLNVLCIQDTVQLKILVNKILLNLQLDHISLDDASELFLDII